MWGRHPCASYVGRTTDAFRGAFLWCNGQGFDNNHQRQGQECIHVLFQNRMKANLLHLP